MTIAYFGYGNPALDSTDLTIQRPDFGTNVTYMDENKISPSKETSNKLRK
jgi:hypothetical protein